MAFNDNTGYIIVFLIFCLEYFLHYKLINHIKPNLTVKQKAYILSIKSSLSMLLVGIYFNYYYIKSGFDEAKFFNILEQTDSLNLGKVIVLYFTAYLLMDVYIGKLDYPSFMKSLSGNLHHTVYIIVNLLTLYIGAYPIYLLCMLSEAPTFLLAIGTFDSKLRNDSLFGVLFFLTRIVYHIVITWMFRKHTFLVGISLSALALHIYWFSQWYKKYGKQIFNKNSRKKH